MVNTTYMMQGTVMGTRMAPSYANMFMGELEKLLLQNTTYKSAVWWRYVDDIFMIWNHGEEQLQKFLKEINILHPTIKFTDEWWFLWFSWFPGFLWFPGFPGFQCFLWFPGFQWFLVPWVPWVPVVPMIPLVPICANARQGVEWLFYVSLSFFFFFFTLQEKASLHNQNAYFCVHTHKKTCLQTRIIWKATYERQGFLF